MVREGLRSSSRTVKKVVEVAFESVTQRNVDKTVASANAGSDEIATEGTSTAQRNDYPLTTHVRKKKVCELRGDIGAIR